MPGVREALEWSIDDSNLTLDALASGLSGRIAESLDVAPENVVAGAGSAALLQQFVSAHAGPGDEVVHPWPSFEMYPLLARNCGAEAVAVPLRGYDQDLEAIAAAITDRTRIVLLCNPNNPTGSLVEQAELESFLDNIPDHVLVLVDEAYREFADPGTLAEALDLSRTDERVAVVRTFSKSHGLLGLRVGYLVAAPSVTAPLRTTVPFFRVGTAAQAAALAAIEADEVMRRQCADVARERERTREALLGLGWEVPPSAGNFLWLPLGERNDSFVDFLAERGVAVRAIAGAGVRVTIGPPEANDAVIMLAKEFGG
ncbi:aspartate aminotransferase [Amycolatopsis antarctica]|uniref:Aspartate aminotransferase n=1 Tax=Amycolatopsis antarctica TaxID=1854586 RepID=A0A263D1Z3_9PSEU|nr:aspartate aminotransferase [Amycolatopsis antarctica]